MISNHLSLVEALRPKSNELAAQFDQIPGRRRKDRRSRTHRVQAKADQLQHPNAAGAKAICSAAPACSASTVVRSRHSPSGERIREMAPTHTLAEVVEALGISRRTLYNIAQAHNVTFKGAARGRLTGKDREQDLEARDAKFAERIRAFLELGITRRQACGRLGIANKTFERIIADQGIEYPKARRGCNSCGA